MNTKPKIQAGTDSFAELLSKSNVFVDKSMFIKEFLEESVGKVALITRPRRWGKSLNMDMLRCFLSIEVDAQGVPLPQEQCLNYKLFAGGEVTLPTGQSKQLSALKIAQHQELMAAYQGKFPVISLGFKDAKGSSYQEIEEVIKKQVFKLYDQHVYLQNQAWLTNNQRRELAKYLNGKILAVDIKISLNFLSELLYGHFGRPVYVLIDEYDTPINSAYLEFKDSPGEFEQVLKLFRGLFGATFKSNPYLEQGLITGILRIAKANLFSDLNNVREYSLLDKRFASCYGFTQHEVDQLLSKVPTPTPAEKIQQWYNGYTFRSEVLYNPWSIMCCLESEGELGHYWLDSGGTDLIDQVLLSDKIQADLQKLAAGDSLVMPISRQIRFQDIDKPASLYSLLLFSGYLNPKAVDTKNDIYQLSIPNDEVGYIYRTRIIEWVLDKLSTDTSSYYTLTELLASGKVLDFEESLRELLRHSTSFHQTGFKVAELFYNGFMLGLLSGLSSYYVIESERESGMGRADALLIPKVGKGSQALIIEYKVGKDVEGLSAIAQEGLEQIENKGYSTKLRDYSHVQSVLQVCMAFCGKEVALKYEQVVL